MIGDTLMLGTVALLAAPGPTNALLFTAGATRGIATSTPLAVSALCGYLVAIALLLYAIGPAFNTIPWLAHSMQATICLYLLWLSWSLWRQSKANRTVSKIVTPRQVAITTLLNPKAAVIAFALFPSSATNDLAVAAPVFATLALLIFGLSLAWIALGACASRSSHGPHDPAIYCRLGAAAMFIFAFVLARGLVAGA